MGRWDMRRGGKHKPMPRPYVCPHCGKTYAVKWALENHVRLCRDRKRVGEKSGEYDKQVGS